MVPSDFSFWWKGFNKDREAVGEELAEIAFEAGRAAENEMCADIAKNWGYTFNRSKDQPWADELNLKLRAQNTAIAERILERRPNATTNQGEKK